MSIFTLVHNQTSIWKGPSQNLTWLNFVFWNRATNGRQNEISCFLFRTLCSVIWNIINTHQLIFIPVNNPYVLLNRTKVECPMHRNVCGLQYSIWGPPGRDTLLNIMLSGVSNVPMYVADYFRFINSRFFRIAKDRVVQVVSRPIILHHVARIRIYAEANILIALSKQL